MSEYDYVFVGGGINALVAAAMLGKKGRTTLVLERNSAIGGCLRTEEVTTPVFSMTSWRRHWSSSDLPASGARQDLEARGFAFADKTSTAVVTTGRIERHSLDGSGAP
jgi:phytoene dehydrogenase-like protein